jgi:hypothetical protein
VSAPPKAKWLLLFNCQAQGLACCLELLHGNVEVESMHALAAREQLDGLYERIDDYERILIAPRVRDCVDPRIAARDNVTWVPHVWFHGYHPDLCFLSFAAPLSTGPTGAYHSAIAYAAWRAGYDLPATLALYQGETFAALGYYDAWAPSREQLLSSYRAHGLDLEAAFVRWTRSGPFMHAINHPKIGVLMDLARAVLRSLGVEPVESGLTPPDNLVNGPVFAVYPELGERLGVPGHYRFKTSDGWTTLDLAQYVEAARAVFAQAGDAQPDVADFLPMLQRAQAYLERRAS